MSVTISLSATVTLACLYTPKLYIILIRPERNVRQSMMPVRLTTFNKSGNDGSMMGPVMLTAATCCQNEKVKSASIDQNKIQGKVNCVNGKICFYHDFTSYTENGSIKYVEIGVQTCTVTDFVFTPAPTKNMGSLGSLHNIPYADQSSLPPIVATTTTNIGAVIESNTNAGMGIVTEPVTTTNQMVSSTSFNNISGNTNVTSCSGVHFSNISSSSSSKPCEESNNKIISKAANNRNETCVRQRNGNFIS